MNAVPVRVQAAAILELRERARKALGSDKNDYHNAVAWIENEFYIPELNGPMVLYPYQKAALTEALRKDASGKFIYDLVIWGDIKKSAKSSIAAAVILYRALNKPWASIKIIANDLKQADSRVAFYARRAIELNSSYFKNWRVKPSGYLIEAPDHAVIEAIPVDPDGEAGAGDDMLEYTELHAFKSKAALKLWTETTLSPLKYGYSQRWADTYAGYSGESPLLEPIYTQVVKSENLLDLGIPGLEAYALGRIFVLWNTSPKLPWQTPEYYASEAATLTPSEFLRIHRNQWVTSENVFVPGEWWDACYGDIPHFDAKTPIVCGMDAGVSSDTFALIGVSRIEDRTYKRFCRVWKPPKGGKIDFSEIDRFIRDELVKQYNVVQIAYDPHQLHDMATRLRRDGVVWMYEFLQGNPRLEADKALYDAIRDRKFIHDGDTQLTEHVKNANSKSTGDIDKLRIVKRAEHLKIDACVALSMANSEARRLAL